MLWKYFKPSPRSAAHVGVSTEVLDGSIVSLPGVRLVLLVSSTLDVLHAEPKVHQVDIPGVGLGAEQQVGRLDVVVSVAGKNENVGF